MTSYPETFSSIRSWAAQNHVTPTEARKRFAQYAILIGISSSRTLRTLLVFKGGNALDFIWQPNRSTTDLDFSVDMKLFNDSFDDVSLASLLDRSLSASGRLLGATLSVHRVKRQPRGEDKTFITYEASIGYALEDEVRLRRMMEEGKPSPNVIRLDISLNEPICAIEVVKIDGSHEIRVCTIEDIIAEKLRALLQQRIRKRDRKQDLLDIVVTLRDHPLLETAKVARYLQEKADARDVSVSRAAFFHPEIAERAARDYETLRITSRKVFIPFEEALQELYAFVRALPLPEDTA